MKTTPPAALFRAFADPTRLRLLHALARGEELCVCDLTALLGSPQSTVSRHLGTLKAAGLVESSSRGKWEYYRVAAPRAELPGRLLACVSGCLGELPEMKADAARLRRRAKAACE